MTPRFVSTACFVFLLGSLSTVCSAQSVLRYSFKPGEDLHYHYKLVSISDRMRKGGGRENEAHYECDPEWFIENVSQAGEAEGVLSIHNRMETVVSGRRGFSGIYFTPKSRIAVARNGNIVYGKILVDDTERNLTKKYVDKIPGLHLMSDLDVLTPEVERLCFPLDTLSIDTTGKPSTRTFDSVIARPFEHDTVTFGRLDTFCTAGMNPFRTHGTSIYTLRDTLIDNDHFWGMRIVTDAENTLVRFPTRNATTFHRMTELVFRKNDGILQSWHVNVENHNGSTSNTNEVWLTLTSMEDN